MIESCFVIIFLCLFFLGLFQLMHAQVSHEILYHAAACAARAKAVGFNYWMVEKTMRVAAIPNAGSLTQPVISSTDQNLVNALATLNLDALLKLVLQSTPTSPTIATELNRIPDYLTSEGSISRQGILDYANWSTIHYSISTTFVSDDPSSAGTITAQVQQPYTMMGAIAALVTSDISNLQSNTITLYGNYTMEPHYQLYLKDQGW